MAPETRPHASGAVPSPVNSYSCPWSPGSQAPAFLKFHPSAQLGSHPRTTTLMVRHLLWATQCPRDSSNTALPHPACLHSPAGQPHPNQQGRRGACFLTRCVFGDSRKMNEASRRPTPSPHPVSQTLIEMHFHPGPRRPDQGGCGGACSAPRAPTKPVFV